jgi:hypothetical protein
VFRENDRNLQQDLFCRLRLKIKNCPSFLLTNRKDMILMRFVIIVGVSCVQSMAPLMLDTTTKSHHVNRIQVNALEMKAFFPQAPSQLCLRSNEQYTMSHE